MEEEKDIPYLIRAWKERKLNKKKREIELLKLEIEKVKLEIEEEKLLKELKDLEGMKRQND